MNTHDGQSRSEASTEVRIMESNAERFDDLVFDAKRLLVECKDTAVHGHILGIQAVAEQGSGSVRAQIERAQREIAGWPRTVQIAMGLDTTGRVTVALTADEAAHLMIAARANLSTVGPVAAKALDSAANKLQDALTGIGEASPRERGNPDDQRSLCSD